MELHHKLRRDPSWHPNACNICGQLGHQAANCTNGTINWRQIYGDDAFVLKDPLYWSDIKKHLDKKKVDVDDLKKRAEEFAKMKSESMGVDYDGMTKKAQEMMTSADNGAPEAAANGSAAAEAEPKQGDGTAAAAPAAAAEEPLPPGWGAAQDTQGRTYYWHKKTQKVQWERPTADTPVDP